MKYIRTKDGIKAYNESCDLSYVYQCIGGIKIADTIEELCDEFVEVKNGDYFGWHFAWNKRSLNEYNKFRKNTHTIYGAIWTDKGLIYVAKMKGILPNGEIDWVLL